MNIQSLFKTIVFLLLLSLTTLLNATTYRVASQQQFDTAMNNAVNNDSIIWLSGTYLDIYLNITKNKLYISSDTLGHTIFTGTSRVQLSGSEVIFKGFQFLNGDIGTNDVINVTGSLNLITQVNIEGYTSYKYLRVREQSQYVTISHCNFENRLNLDDQNILSILVDSVQPGYHKIQYCSFKNFNGTGNDMGIEPIRIGLSTQANFISRTVVEYCYFTQCDGDGELISSKARQNIYRHNTFDNNTKAELVLRHGAENIVYGNFFLNGMGGVRVREGQNQYIYNNYFYNLSRRAIYLQDDPSDRLDSIHIAFNTVINCEEIRLGDGPDEPTNVTFANNIFATPKGTLFDDETGTETWINNIVFGSLGIAVPASGVTNVDPSFAVNSIGFFSLTANSPAVDSAGIGFPSLPNYSGISAIDDSVNFDIMQQRRPAAITNKDLGCSEYSNTVVVQPLATDNNTGPSYMNPTPIGLFEQSLTEEKRFRIYPNPVEDRLHISFLQGDIKRINYVLYTLEGKLVREMQEYRISDKEVLLHAEELPVGAYLLRVEGEDVLGEPFVQSVTFLKKN